MADTTLRGASAYFDAVTRTLRQVIESQAEAIACAAEVVFSSLKNGGVIFLFGTGHSHLLAEEGHYRAGGLAAVVPILDEALMLHKGAINSTQLERERGRAAALLARYHPEARDTLFVFSNSGVNAVPVEMALAGKAVGMQVIAVVARQYESAAPLGSVGKKLSDVADIVIDNGGVRGDAVVPLGETGIQVGPTSTITGAFILNAVLVEAAARLAEQGLPVPAYISANVPGSSEHNQQLLAQYRTRNPHL